MKAGSFLMLLAGFPALVLAEAVDERIDAEATGDVEVRNISGEIVVSGWDNAEVRVTGEISEQAERLDLRREGSRVVVEVVYPENWRGNGNFGDETSLSISVPRGSSLTVETVSADVSVSGVEGEQALSSVSGDVVTETFGAEARFESVSGDVLVNGRDAVSRTSASAVSGDVELNRISGEITVQSVSGDIDIASGIIERAEIQSVSGDVSLSGELAGNARVRANSTSGDVDLMLRGDASADYSLTSFSGDIDNCFGPARTQAVRGQPGSTLRFTEGSSRASVEVSTMSGDIDLCR
jgi:DUF4097 and DUF4098 domain-containing protein YvlB